MKMRIKISLSLLMALLSLSGCITLRPFPINARAENLKIDPAAKLLLNVAIVIPDPMGNRVIETSRRYNIYGMEMNNTTQDRTSMFGERGAPVGRELSRVAGDVFSQVFVQSLTLRQPPQPGEYDAVVEVRISQTHMMTVTRSSIGSSKLESEVSLDYEITVLDNQGVEIFNKKARTRTEKSNVQGFNVTEQYMDGIGALLSNLVTDVAKEAGLAVYASEEVNRYANRLKSSP
ncbi:MAG: hypothetical protein WCH07_02150 [Deltaproteobacteria bacterium]